MPRYSDNYYNRKCFIEREQVPTQTVMKEKMTPSLANVYFKSMTPKLKILAGLEPALKGGGNDWYVPPEDILEGKAILKPLKKEYLSKLGYNGIGFYGNRFVEAYSRQLEIEKERILLENDLYWKRSIETSCRQQWVDKSKALAKLNTLKIQEAFHEFTVLYSTSITKIEQLMFDAAVKEIERVKEETYSKMSKQYESLLQQQAKMLYDTYTGKLNTEKEKIKAKFIRDLEHSKTELGNQIHDINVEKHVAIEKLRSLLECQNLACQVYVALKERGEFSKEIELSKHEHAKEMKTLIDQLAMKNFEVMLAQEKERKRQEFSTCWKKKVCHVVKRFQDFVHYCLCKLPEYAEFFINTEKLMLLQLNDALDNPSLQSIFVADDKEFLPTPIPKPHPFYVFCDKGFKPELQEDLCPKHCTSSASQLPVIVVNKRFVYAACDNLQMFSEKARHFIDGKRGEDEDFIDDHGYTYDIPAKHTSSKEILHLKLESSIMQILQNEFPNIRNVKIQCPVCKIPHCFCSPLRQSDISLYKEKKYVPPKSIPYNVNFGNVIDSRETELGHGREPKWDSYMEFILPKCPCAKTAKKHLAEHMPPYMIKMSKYDAPELIDYETCDLNSLKRLVKKARKIHSPPPTPKKAESKTRNTSTQYSDQEYEFLCTCFSDDEINKILQTVIRESKLFDEHADPKFQIVDGNISSSYLKKQLNTFAHEAALSLRQSIDESPDLEEIFMKKDCKF